MIPKYKLVKPTRSRFWLIRLAHPSPEGWREKSTKESRRRDAERVAAQIVAGLADVETPRLTWQAFRKTYETDHLSTLAAPGVFKSAAAKLEAMVKPRYLDELDAAYMKRWRQKMIAAGMKPTTVTTYLKHVRASLGWAEENGYLKSAPRVRAACEAKRKGRAITLEEFERVLAEVPKLLTSDIPRTKRKPNKPPKAKRKPPTPRKPRRVFKDPKPMVRLLWGLWYLGLRLQESLDFSWDDDNQIRPIRLDGPQPLLSFPVRSHKNRKDQLVPLTPEGAAFLRATPPRQRHGRVFPLPGSSRPITEADRASRVISAIGKRARVVTSIDPDTGAKRHFTAHDLRRSFAQRLVDRRLPSGLLKALMRHADIKTTETHYATADAEQLAADVWQALGAAQ
jgi:integrase